MLLLLERQLEFKRYFPRGHWNFRGKLILHVKTLATPKLNHYIKKETYFYHKFNEKATK